ncbi:AAA family ATPase [Janthinobacterium sp. AD80]|uniref:AAA family ATPase n=1 Tax=Janthinobacterium sp. AD80 TaxID=1528773 RepID=UPI000C86815C|nr:AAA family ATPase [Janthinobacterium sp. AD80]PMQ18401.1 DNA replication and repair protein RecF [Janthinobacterium sp. AD80]
MALLDEILTWSKADLKPWQQDAARRLFQQTLTTTALDDLYAMMKESVGLPDPNNRKPEPLDQQHLPVTATKDDAVVLTALRDVKNVNRLAASQILSFAPKGLTVIYGGNGSGKSGYARVLKRACRSRDSSEDVRPNAMSKASAALIPQASFEIQLGGKSSTVIWQKGKASPAELATVAVFDTHCARAYLDQQQEIAYLPFGLDVVENLAQIVLPKILEKLNAEILATVTTKESFNHLVGTTKVGALLSALSEKTTVSDVDALAQMNADDTRKMVDLEKTLNESDPNAKAKELKLAAARMTGLKTKIESATAWVKDESIQKLRTMDMETQTALAAEIAAATALRSGEALLPGTGDIIWKTLFQAAKEFSIDAAYPGKDFPHIHDDSQCVLCQQKIEPDAAARMQRFEAYVQENVAKVANDKRSACAAALTKIRSVVLALDLDDALIEELNQLDIAVVAEINAFDALVQSRRTWLLAAQEKHSWDNPPAFPVDPCIRLKTLAESLTAQEKIYEQATDDKQKLVLKAELEELKARAALTPHRQAIIDLIERMRIKSLLNKCKNDLKTKPISDKAKEFASNAVTAPLRAALKEEFEALGVSALMPKLSESVERGKMKHKLELDLEIQAQIREILSEGEQRSIALGSFLAELRTGGHGGGIVFDDPVSSLDHFRRQNVAQRLVLEAKARQVIIFTHDTSFLGDLQDLIQKTNIDHIIHHLEWEGEFSGKISTGLPWLHQTFKGRIDELEQAQSKLAKSWPQYPNDEQSAAMRTQYSKARATIERSIQDIVFNGVVVRYRDWIKVGDLHKVVGFDAKECSEIERLHKICCDVIDGHDSSSGKNAPVPSAADLGKLIAELAALGEAIRNRQNKKPPVTAAAPKQ